MSVFPLTTNKNKNMTTADLATLSARNLLADAFGANGGHVGFLVDELNRLVRNAPIGQERAIVARGVAGIRYDRYDPLMGLRYNDAFWKAVDDLCWMEEANAEVVSTFYSEEE